jgi:hypothetical protein
LLPGSRILPKGGRGGRKPSKRQGDVVAAAVLSRLLEPPTELVRNPVRTVTLKVLLQIASDLEKLGVIGERIRIPIGPEVRWKGDNYNNLLEQPSLGRESRGRHAGEPP